MARELVESDGDGAFDDVAVLVDEGQVIGSGSFGADGLGDGEHPVAVADDGRQDVAHGSGLFGLDVEVVGFPAASQPDIHELPGDRQVGEDVGGVAPGAEGGVPLGFGRADTGRVAVRIYRTVRQPFGTGGRFCPPQLLQRMETVRVLGPSVRESFVSPPGPPVEVSTQVVLPSGDTALTG